MSRTFTDLHTHILPAVDDGARNLESALKLLRWQWDHCVRRVALTPHFYPTRESLDAFIQRRQQGYSMLMEGWDPATMPDLQLGAEVSFSPYLIQMDLRKLTIGGNDYLLLELPDIGTPTHLEQVVKGMLMQGITPILAHIDRCMFLRQNPQRLFELVQMGALAQLSTRAFEMRRDRQFAEICLRNGLAHIIASDVHRLERGDPSLGEFGKKLTIESMNRAEEFARSVWDNTCPPAFGIRPINKGFFGYY